MPSLSIITSLYRGAKYLPGFFEQIAVQTIFDDCELVLVHNDPTDEELAIVGSFDALHPGKINHIQVEREPLARSWNRGWQAAQGDVIAIWNVDDRRMPTSLAQQVANLLDNSSVFSYGDYIEVRAYGAEAGVRRTTPEFERKHFSRSFAGGGAFMVFLKLLGETIGYFDESLKTASDYDFSLRVALNGLNMCKTPNVMGYFTNAAEGLSTRDDVAIIERTVLQMRYAIYDKVRWQYQKQAEIYALNEIEVMETNYPLMQFVPELDTYRARHRYLWIFGWVRNIVRGLLRGLGILRLVYWVQDKVIGREV